MFPVSLLLSANTTILNHIPRTIFNLRTVCSLRWESMLELPQWHQSQGACSCRKILEMPVAVSEIPPLTKKHALRQQFVLYE